MLKTLHFKKPFYILDVMLTRFWRYNPAINKFSESDDEPLSVFPTLVKVEKERQLVFCRLHHKWEQIFAFGKGVLKTSCGKLYEGPFVKENSIVNYGYNVQKRGCVYTIRVKSQTAVTHNRRLLENVFELDLAQKNLRMNGKALFDTDNIQSKLCEEITTKILDELGEKYNAEYGIKPCVSSSLKGFDLVLGYMLCPFNVNFFKISQHWGLNPYDKDFISLSSGNSPSAENEMFESLGIKPTRQLRKLYQKIPQSVVCYSAAKDLGFTDVNILQKSVTPAFYKFLSHYMITFCGSDVNYALRDGLRTFTHDMLALSAQKTVWASVERTLAIFSKKIVPENVIEDGITSYVHCREFLTAKEKKDVMHEGFSQYTHDFLVRRLNNVAEQRMNAMRRKTEAKILKLDCEPFNIEQSFLDLEYKCGDDWINIKKADGQIERVKVADEERYCFFVAKTGGELKVVGSEMRNCVGWGYENAVRSRRSTIVYAKFRGKYKICIEVTPDFRIRQSLGPSNKPLQGADLEAYHEWCDAKHIHFEKAFKIHIAP